MPVTFTAIGTGVSATVVDGNFDEVVRLLREQVKNADVLGNTIDRWAIRQYTGGKITKAETRSKPIYDEKYSKNVVPGAYQDLIFRDTLNAILGSPGYVSNRVGFASFELLGRPGPSFYWDFQENGTAYAGVIPDPRRFDDSFCYSEWLTVPGCSLKVYVPNPCVVRMKGLVHLIALLNGVFEWESYAVPGWSIANAGLVDFYPLQLGLVVDTNPNLYTDEFVNNNVYIKTPNTAVQAPYCSFAFAEKRTIYAPQWCKDDITGEIFLKGGRWYNFSLKFKRASTRGYDLAGTIQDDIYERAIVLPNFNGARRQSSHAYPSEIVWLSNALSLEFIYGYDQHYQNSVNIVSTP